MADEPKHTPSWHSTRYWKRHPERQLQALGKLPVESGQRMDSSVSGMPLYDVPRMRLPAFSRKLEMGGTRPLNSDMSTEHEHRGQEFLLAGFGLMAEFLALTIGETSLGWAAALLFFGAFHEYTKSFLKGRRVLVQWGIRIAAVLVLSIATQRAIIVMEAHIHNRMVAPTVRFSLTTDKTLVIDNSKGRSVLKDFEINALEYYLDMHAFANDYAQIASRSSIGGDLDFKHFDVGAREVKRIDLTKDRYGFILAMSRPNPVIQAFDDEIHYLCLRLVFTNEDSGETLVHYVVLSPYVNGINLVEHPEMAASGKRPPGTEGFPFSIRRVIKADARLFYGTEYREYQP